MAPEREIRQTSSTPVEWRVSERPVAYPEALAAMEARVEAILAGRAAEQVWLLEHPPLYTAGTSAKPGTCSGPTASRSIRARRGGEYTYHGPGPAGRLRDARPRPPRARRARLRLAARGMGDPHARRLRGHAASGARAASGSGWSGPTGRRSRTAARPRTRSPRSACGCAAGSPSTASRSTSSPTSGTSPASCPAASAATA